MNFKDIVSRLEKICPESSEYEARILFESCAEQSIPPHLAHSDFTIDDEELCAKLELYIKRREAHEPLQYIVGEWDFYKQKYFVSRDCLIPRSDTEVLVEHAIRLLPQNARFADLCTGSGCIAVSTLCERPDTTAVMVEKFPSTMDVAIANAIRNGVQDRGESILMDLLTDEERLAGREFDAILSNPPYIRPEVIEALSEEVKFEPYAALYGGEDGLVFYRKIIETYSKFVKKGGFMLLEIGYDQADDLKNIAQEHGYNCEIFKDYGGNDRVAYITGF